MHSPDSSQGYSEQQMSLYIVYLEVFWELLCTVYVLACAFRYNLMEAEL